MYQTEKKCSVNGCNEYIYHRGFCKSHYDSNWRKIPKHSPCSIPEYHGKVYSRGFCRIHYIENVKGKCCVDGCQNHEKTSGYCGMHYGRFCRTGSAGEPGRRQAERGTGFIRDGYKYIPCLGHPNSDKHGCIREHTKIMSDILGRPLLRSETVHHRNGDKLDNRFDNLELWSSNHPSGQRVSDLVIWARKIISMYGEFYK